MKFKNLKEIAYKSTGPVLKLAGIAYVIKGFVNNDAEEIGVGFSALMGGMLVSARTKYITETIDKLNGRISDLEKKAEVK